VVAAPTGNAITNLKMINGVQNRTENVALVLIGLIRALEGRMRAKWPTRSCKFASKVGEQMNELNRIN
jgi:hypothetical protein